MRLSAALFVLLAAGCASYGPAEDYRWSLVNPESVARGADFVFQVQTFAMDGVPVPAEGEEADVPALEPVAEEGVPFHYMIVWPGGSTMPLRRFGHSGEELKVRARVIKGKATLLIHAEDAEGRSIKVCEAAFQVN